MKYQLVLQLSASSLADYDKLIELEDRIIKVIGILGKVDGHDMGSSEMNIFIFTDSPQLAFERIQSSGVAQDLIANLKAAYRYVDGESFIVIYPAGLSKFSVA